MKRNSSFLSPLGISLTLTLFLVLGSMFWTQGGLLFSPGDVSAKARPGVTLGGFNSHAEFEAQCERCHLPLETTQDVLCLKCHIDIGKQITENIGTHAQMESVNRCADCHSDHQGREFDPTVAALAHFDHTATEFDLIWHQFDYAALPMNCEACHTSGEDLSVRSESCLTCHSSHDEASNSRNRGS